MPGTCHSGHIVKKMALWFFYCTEVRNYLFGSHNDFTQKKDTRAYDLTDHTHDADNGVYPVSYTHLSMRVERVEPFSLNMEKDSTESTDNSEVSEKKTSEDESVEDSQTAADQETLTEKDEIKEIERIMCSMMSVLRDENATANALRRRFPAKAFMECEHVIPFSSDRKYSGAVFHAEGTYLMGAAQFLFPDENKQLTEYAQKYAEEGLRVLVLAHSTETSEEMCIRDRR